MRKTQSSEDGRLVNPIVPGPHRPQEEIDKALDGIRELRQRTGQVNGQELLSAREEGRRS